MKCRREAVATAFGSSLRSPGLQTAMWGARSAWERRKAFLHARAATTFPRSSGGVAVSVPGAAAGLSTVCAAFYGQSETINGTRLDSIGLLT